MSTSSPRVSSPSTNPNSNLVSAMMMPLVSAYSRARDVNRQRQIAQPVRTDLRRSATHVRSKEIFSSWPVCALVAGVKIGSGSLSLSRNPAGSGMPHTVPLCMYSFQPEPGNVAARHAFDLHHLGALHQHRAAFQLIAEFAAAAPDIRPHSP